MLGVLGTGVAASVLETTADEGAQTEIETRALADEAKEAAARSTARKEDT